MSPLHVSNFSPIVACIGVLWWILQSAKKVEEKNKGIEIKFWLLVS